MCPFFFFFPFTERFSTKVCSSFMDIINTGAVRRNFTCKEGPTARGSSKICLQTGRNQNVKICHRCIFVSYASRVDCSFTGAAGTVSENWMLVLPLGPSSKILNKRHKALGLIQKRKQILTPTGTNSAQSQLVGSFSDALPPSLTLKEALKTVWTENSMTMTSSWTKKEGISQVAARFGGGKGL